MSLSIIHQHPFSDFPRVTVTSDTKISSFIEQTETHGDGIMPDIFFQKFKYNFLNY